MHQYPETVVITGANRGIGLGLVREFLKRNEVKKVFATARDPDDAQELNAIEDHRLTVVKMDVLCDDSIKAAVDQVDSALNGGGLNLLINNAGVLIGYFWNEDPDRKKIEDTLNANTVGPMLVTHYFLPLLRRSAASEWGISHSAIINISSDFASMGGCPVAGSSIKGVMPYKMSKAALNQFGKVLAQDLHDEKILVANFHPGWVATDMGGCEAPVTIEDCTSSLVTSFSLLKEHHSGGFFNNQGEVMPW